MYTKLPFTLSAADLPGSALYLVIVQYTHQHMFQPLQNIHPTFLKSNLLGSPLQSVMTHTSAHLYAGTTVSHKLL
jgi:hypothetical protein